MELEQVFKSYRDYKTKIEGKSKNSIDQYLYRIQSFLDYNSIKTKEDLLKMSSQNVKNWLSYLADKGNKERSRNTKLTAVKEVYKFLKDEFKDQIDEDILRIPFAKVPKREAKCLDFEDAMDLLSYVKDSRVKTGMAIGFGTGVRFCELIQITCTDIENGYADIIGKGNKERRIWFDLWVQEIARQFINGKRARIVEKNGKQNDDTLMLNDNGNVIFRNNFERSMKTWAKKFNAEPLYEGRLDWYDHFSPHKLRHSFGTEQLRRGNDIATVRDEMGHSNIATTNNYSHSNGERVRMAMLNETNKKQKEEEKEVELLLKKLMENKDLRDKVKEMIGDEQYGEKKE